MAETDIARVVSLIMENPELVEQIKALASEEKPSEVTPEEKVEQLTQGEPEARREVALHSGAEHNSKRRGELLEALKPYMSDERQRALASFAAIADVLDIMRAK